MQFETRVVTEADAQAASALVHASFVAHVAADWEPDAQQTFLSESSPESMAKKIREATYAYGAFSSDQIVGFIYLPTPALLGMLFVHPRCLRQGVGHALWQQARAHIEAAFLAVKTIELNASPYAVPFYQTIGFVAISAEFKRGGSRATRMACWLPARALGAECVATVSSGNPPAACIDITQ
jgi:GNAT superfamily N-acetyltransferase